MDYNDYLTLFNFIFLWVQPIFWMYFFYNKTKKLDKLAVVIIPTIVMFIVAIFVILQFIPLEFLDAYPTGKLLLFYSGIGLTFASYLMIFKRWHFPQAISISAIIVFIGSFYWESPYIIRNISVLGFQLDWILHIMGLMLVWYIAKSIGWKMDKISLGLVISGFILATILMIGYPMVGSGDASIWNSPYFLFDRLVCTVIAFAAIKKDAPVWRNKN